MGIERELKYYFDNKNTGREECALVVESVGGVLSIYTCRNMHETPETDFMVSSIDFVKASAIGKVVGVAHSHVNGNKKLSATDRIYQHHNRLTYWLYCDGEVSKGEPIQRLKGRNFHEGKLDCYDIMKDFYFLCGVDMGSYSQDEGYRIPDWHHKQGVKSPFIENMGKEGFVEVERMVDMIPGDVIISLLASNIPNHCLIYFGDNRVFHHLPDRLSGDEMIRDYFVKMKHSIWRRNDAKELPIKEVIDSIMREPNL